MKHKLNEIIAKHTGKPVKKVEKDADRDYFIGAREAVEYGLVDKVIS